MSSVFKNNDMNDLTKNFSVSLLLYLAILSYSYFSLNITILDGNINLIRFQLLFNERKPNLL
jgi:hypothetical protein